MKIFLAIVLMPIALRCELYIGLLKALGFSYNQAIAWVLVGVNVATIIGYIVIVVQPKWMRLPRKIKNWRWIKRLSEKRKLKEKKNHGRTERVLSFLHQWRLFFLLPVFIFFVSLFAPLIPLPISIICFLLIKKTSCRISGLAAMVASSLIKAYVETKLIFGISEKDIWETVSGFISSVF